ncbi:MAG: UbiX family flavin prenyltransferase [Candidatus Methylarchaceae archaeon HK02M1]|nr:UbiX family flavin prenyltransferase [Candidatus Methylarchaceae archaeon HK02M1]
MRIVVGITGASGVIYGKRLLEVLSDKGVETHVIVSRGAAEEIIAHELTSKRKDIEKLATRAYQLDDLLSPLASGSYITDGMVIVPCSAKTMAGIAHGYSDNLILRAAEVTIKQGRKLILVPRETPLSAIFIENMLKLARIGVVILPAMPAFYHNPKNIDQLIDFVVGKILDSFGLDHNLFKRWRNTDSKQYL